MTAQKVMQIGQTHRRMRQLPSLRCRLRLWTDTQVRVALLAKTLAFILGAFMMESAPNPASYQTTGKADLAIVEALGTLPRVPV